MDERDEQAQAAEALAAVRTHQERTERAARLPWWVYAAMFVLIAAVTAANDFVDIGGAKLIALLVLVALVVALAITFAGRSAPLSRMRGVQRRQSFSPPLFGAAVLVFGAGSWVISQYGVAVTTGVADAAGLHDYPETVAGVLFGAVFTAVFALFQPVVTRTRRTGQ